MAWLTAVDELPLRPARILVAGTSGSGKSTLARGISTALAIPYFELDALHHGPSWTPRPEFAEEVATITSLAGWVTEWQYQAVRELLADRADLLVWLDLPRRVVMTRIARRTLGRRLRRTELWNANQEPPLHTIFFQPDHIIRWAWRTHAEHLDRITNCAAQHPDLVIVRLRSRADVAAWLSGPLVRAAGSGGGN